MGYRGCIHAHIHGIALCATNVGRQVGEDGFVFTEAGFGADMVRGEGGERRGRGRGV